ncbi:hypothetical protein ACFLYO_00600 [Chloroflexota bacterium]
MNKGTLGLVIAVVLIVGGFISLQIIASGPDSVLPVRVQTLNPEGSTLEATPQQALYFLAYSAIAIGSLVLIAVVLAVIFRFLDREITQAKAQ